MEKIIARHARTFSAAKFGYNGHYAFKAEAKLYQLGGNQHPYFSVQGEIFHKATKSMREGGCMHEAVLKVWPSCAPIVALHLSDYPSGEPMHGEANGFYNLAGACGGLGEEYHVGQSERHFPIEPPEGKPWQNTEYRLPTAEECLAIFAEHCRISVEEARGIAEKVRDAYDYTAPTTAGETGKTAARRLWREIYEGMKPRFAAEAAAGLELIEEWNRARAEKEGK